MELIGINTHTDQFSSTPKVRVFKPYDDWYEARYVSHIQAQLIFLRAIEIVRCIPNGLMGVK